MSQNTPPSARRAQRPPRINIKNLQNVQQHSSNNNAAINGSIVGSMPPTAQIQSQPPLLQPPPFTPQTAATIPMTASGQPYWPNYANPFAPGNFMVKGFEGFVDFTKSGMSFGEKFTYGLYEKFSKWSKKWFTHMFLFIVVALYSVGGALLFGAIEGRKATQEAIDTHALQKDFFRAMQDLSQDHELRKYSTAEFNGRMVYTLREHQTALETLLNNNKTLEELEKRKEPWSFWNAMFYCGTIYTTIDMSMSAIKKQRLGNIDSYFI